MKSYFAVILIESAIPTFGNQIGKFLFAKNIHGINNEFENEEDALKGAEEMIKKGANLKDFFIHKFYKGAV